MTLLRSDAPAPLVDRDHLHQVWLELGAVVHASAELMTARAGSLSADDITVAAFVAFARGEGDGAGDALARLLRLAGQAARAGRAADRSQA